MSDWKNRYVDKLVTAETAVAQVVSGQRVFVGSGAAEPERLVEALAARGRELADTQIAQIMTLGMAPYTDAKLKDGFRTNAFFIGPNVREAVAEGRADYTPIFLSEIPGLFRRGQLPLDVAMIHVSPPDAHGYCSYGVSVDVVKAAAESAGTVIAEVNARMPRTLGDSFIHVDQIDALVASDRPVIEAPVNAIDEVAARIGRHVADLVEDGSTLQLGIGTIPDAVLAALGDKRDLGIHTEMFSDGVIDLVEKGVINGSRKSIHPGKIVTSFVIGSRRLYDFVDNNPLCEFHPSEYTNDPFRISRHERMVAVNSALQLDLTGQVCADSLGTYFYSGIGGQLDFIRGASRSMGGKPIIALPSTAKGGTVSRIVPMLTPGAGVVTSRGDVHFVATEWGVADLHGKTIRERALALIHIAHPDFRDELMEDARRRRLVYSDQVAVRGAGTPELRAFESDHAIDEKNIHIRPVKPTDEEMLRELFYACSPETRYHRFFSTLKAMPHAKLKEFVEVDYRNQMVLVALDGSNDHEEIVAVGCYTLDRSSKTAELAFLVRDDWQHHGLGTVLFRRTVAVARKRGIIRFTADVFADNAPMLRVFHRAAPGPVESSLDAGIYHLAFTAKVGEPLPINGIHGRDNANSRDPDVSSGDELRPAATSRPWKSRNTSTGRTDTSKRLTDPRC